MSLAQNLAGMVPVRGGRALPGTVANLLPPTTPLYVNRTEQVGPGRPRTAVLNFREHRIATPPPPPPPSPPTPSPPAVTLPAPALPATQILGGDVRQHTFLQLAHALLEACNDTEATLDESMANFLLFQRTELLKAQAPSDYLQACEHMQQKLAAVIRSKHGGALVISSSIHALFARWLAAHPLHFPALVLPLDRDTTDEMLYRPTAPPPAPSPSPSPAATPKQVRAHVAAPAPAATLKRPREHVPEPAPAKRQRAAKPEASPVYLARLAALRERYADTIAAALRNPASLALNADSCTQLERVRDFLAAPERRTLRTETQLRDLEEQLFRLQARAQTLLPAAAPSPPVPPPPSPAHPPPPLPPPAPVSGPVVADHGARHKEKGTAEGNGDGFLEALRDFSAASAGASLWWQEALGTALRVREMTGFGPERATQVVNEVKQHIVSLQSSTAHASDATDPSTCSHGDDC